MVGGVLFSGAIYGLYSCYWSVKRGVIEWKLEDVVNDPRLEIRGIRRMFMLFHSFLQDAF